MNAAIYVRVSTDQQAEKGYSIDTQLEACRKYALELGATNMEEFVDDGYSGEFIDRPALTALRQKLKDNYFNVVIAYAPDRLARKTIHLLIISEEISKAGALRKFASVNFEATSEGELMYKFQGIVAEYEKEKIKERTMRGKRGKAAKGLVISNAKPFGYIFDTKKSTYIINEAEAAIVRMIFDFLIHQKFGTARICQELNSRGIPSPRAKKGWIVSSIHRILTNSLYKGIIYSMKYRYEKIGLNKKKRTLRPESEWIPIRVPAIIDEHAWQAAQKQLHENKSHAKRNQKHEYLLNGLVTCAKCGKNMVISLSGPNSISYYACLTQKSTAYIYSKQKPCIARQIPASLLDEYVYRYLFDKYFNAEKMTDLIDSLSQCKEIQKYKTSLEQMNATANELLQQKKSVLRWFRQKILSEQEIECQLADINKQLSDIALLRNEYESDLAAITPKYVESTFPTINKDSFTLPEKKAAIQAVVEQVIAERVDNTRGRGSCPEIRVQIKLK